MSTAAPAAPTAAPPPKQPEMKFGPFAGGLSVAIWRNTVETEDGAREIRSVTVNPRRYRDPDSSEWKNGSYRVSDIATLALALTAVLQFVASHPLPQPAEEEPPETHNGEATPFRIGEWNLNSQPHAERLGVDIVRSPAVARRT